MKKATTALLVAACALGASAPAMAGTPASASKFNFASLKSKSHAASAIHAATIKANPHALKGLYNAGQHVNVSNGC
ncbi:hypothetical protein MTR62_02755 [Novosphingobium sp. 1949]|uniref:Uncharacterized protein n=1 Tax=Novosphingobium organovorum TaxID=2930092 RepID=A0ABT0B981_9SPHN|nr:hypothetical protein [Novosphingobium organovorum]MCJ2181632.1 hypothetical protein [Novosphingobium organovorum]